MKKIKEIAQAEGISLEKLIDNIKLRDRATKIIRKNSSFTLKQIGQLFGGISESRVSRILGKKD